MRAVAFVLAGIALVIGGPAAAATLPIPLPLPPLPLIGQPGSAGNPGSGQTTVTPAAYYPVAHYRPWSVGENLLWKSRTLTAADVVQEWLGRPPHRHNLLLPSWTQIGVAVINATAAPALTAETTSRSPPPN